MKAFEIGLSAMNVEWQRFAVIADNLANINSALDASGQAVPARRLLSGPAVSFSELMTNDPAAYRPSGVQVLAIEELNESTRMVYEPDHPSADAEGFVTYPNVDHGREMSLLVKTLRVYEANLALVSIAERMYSKALELGRRS